MVIPTKEMGLWYFTLTDFNLTLTSHMTGGYLLDSAGLETDLKAPSRNLCAPVPVSLFLIAPQPP